MKKTKKAFREFLNNKYGIDTTSRMARNQVAKTRKYGDYLYSADKGMFDYEYSRWLSGELQ